MVILSLYSLLVLMHKGQRLKIQTENKVTDANLPNELNSFRTTVVLNIFFLLRKSAICPPV